MKLHFIPQPLPGRGQVGPAILEALATAHRFSIVVAWAQVSGVRHLETHVGALRERGGVAEAIVGIDQGIATIEGLEAVAKLFAPAYIFHVRGRTFHPKLYLIEGSRRATVILGSANLTAGGLYSGYEASVALELDKRNAADARTLSRFTDYFELLRRSRRSCIVLDPVLLRKLRADPRFRKSSRDLRAEARRKVRVEKAVAALFGRPPRGLGRIPRIAADIKRRRRSRKPRGSARRGLVRSAATGRIAASWSKRLTASDAMRKPPGSHERRYVVLSRAGHPIDQEQFFRRRFFVGVRWTLVPMRRAPGRTRRTKEVADVPFDVFVDNRFLGQFPITIDHARARIADQRNAPTYLNWSSLSDLVRRRDLRGYYLVLDRLVNGRFRLSLVRQEPNR